MPEFIDRLCDFMRAPGHADAAVLDDAWVGISDTVAVALAGWDEPSARAVRQAYGSSEDPAFGQPGLDAEREALIQGTAAHALDYDDVALGSVTHPSAVIVPALLAVAARRPDLRPRVLAAYAVGLAVDAAVGEALGFGHYDRGWHATSTIGPISAAAALGYLVELEPRGARSLLALAAAQCGGMQRNFGTLAKPAHVGFAAATAVRALLLVEAGMTGDQDIFGPGGYFDLYGDAAAAVRAANCGFALAAGRVSRKLYPCCYATHRMIGAALAARDSIAHPFAPDLRIVVDVPYGTMRPLRFTDPRDGNEAKFCAAYTVATALGTGTVRLGDFTAEAIARPAIRALMKRIAVVESPNGAGVVAGLDSGDVHLRIVRSNETVVEAISSVYPGSPLAPIGPEQLWDKISDCLRTHARTHRKIARSEFERKVGQYVARCRSASANVSPRCIPDRYGDPSGDEFGT